MNTEFFKYQGTGNDFILIDDREALFDATDRSFIAELCHRRFGIGADGLILLQAADEVDFHMQYFNSDGRESSMCGNGGRCIVRFAHDLGLIDEHAVFSAVDGLHEAEVLNVFDISLQMKPVKDIERIDQDTYVLNTGSPHYVHFVNAPPTAPQLLEFAQKIRYGERFIEEGINVNLVYVMSNGNLGMRTYERGVEAETYSCGTGVTAAAICHGLRQDPRLPDKLIKVNTPGGELSVTYDHYDDTFRNVQLTGPALKVFEGSILH